MELQHKVGDITALENYPLPHLQCLNLSSNNVQSFPTSLENYYTNLKYLYLCRNKIGRESCMSIARLLEKEGACLKYIDLESNDVGDVEAETLANSLQYNTVLTTLDLGGENNFKDKGFRALLKLLNDVSSIDSTYSSNHTLTALILPESANAAIQEMTKHIESAIGINRSNDGNSHAAGRAKVIETQLNSHKRKVLCCLWGVDYSYESIFSDIEPLLLPEVIALVGGNYGHDELYRMLLVTAPYLLSAVNRSAVIKERIAALLGEVHELNKELASLDSADTNQPMNGRKRGREN